MTESLVALAAVFVIVGGLMAVRARGGPGLSPDQASVALILDETPTPAPTFTRAPLPTSTLEAPPPVDTAPVVSVITYTISSGDTISGIAQRFDVGTDELVAANPDSLGNPDTLRIGQEIAVPIEAPEVGSPPQEAGSGDPPTVAEAPSSADEAPGGAAPAAGEPGEQLVTAPAEIDPALSAKLGVPVAATPSDGGNSAAAPGSITPGTRTATNRGGEAVAAIERDQSVAAALEAPWPVAPAEGAVVTGESPVLRWSSAGVLPAGAHYVLEIRGVDDAPGATARIVWVVSNANAARVPGDLRPPLGTSKRFTWTVSVRTRTGRLIGEDPGELLGRSSAPKTFDWAP